MPLPAFIAAGLPSLISTFGALFGGALQRSSSRRDIAAQNAYNSPVNQVAKLREAGLPMAALEHGQAGNQSALPVANDRGLSEAGNRISNFISRQIELKQLQMLEAQIRVANKDADLKEAEASYLLSGRGEDKAGTNLTTSLKSRISLAEGQSKGQELANKIQGSIAENTPKRLLLENTKLVADISKTLSDIGLIQSHTRGAELDNKIKSVVASYQERMSDAQLIRLLKSNDLLTENIEGAKLDNALGEIRNHIARETQNDTIRITKMSLLSAVQNYEVAKEYFHSYKQYQMFVRRVQDAFANEKDLSFGERWKVILAGIYTSIMGNQGSGNLPGLLNSLGGGGGTFNYTGQSHKHFHDYHD